MVGHDDGGVNGRGDRCLQAFEQPGTAEGVFAGGVLRGEAARAVPVQMSPASTAMSKTDAPGGWNVANSR